MFRGTCLRIDQQFTLFFGFDAAIQPNPHLAAEPAAQGLPADSQPSGGTGLGAGQKDPVPLAAHLGIRIAFVF